MLTTTQPPADDGMEQPQLTKLQALIIMEALITDDTHGYLALFGVEHLDWSVTLHHNEHTQKDERQLMTVTGAHEAATFLRQLADKLDEAQSGCEQPPMIKGDLP